MSRLILSLCVTGSLVVAISRAEGQSGTDPYYGTTGARLGAMIQSVIADSANSYDSRALRIESSWSGMRVIRGAEGPVEGTVGMFRSFDVEKLVNSSPEAVAEARSFRRNRRAASVVGALGAAVFSVGVVSSANFSNNAATPMLVIAGGGAMVWAANRLNTAYGALSRAVWWHNRGLGR